MTEKIDSVEEVEVPTFVVSQINGISENIRFLVREAYNRGFQAGLRESEKWRLNDKLSE